jgi:hypothetical protein
MNLFLSLSRPRSTVRFSYFLRLWSSADSFRHPVGRELTKTMRELCARHDVVFKEESKWGATEETDERLTGKNFGDFKSANRLQTDASLLAYMVEPSPTRSGMHETKRDFTVAVTLAPPGTGKSRLLDDAVRAPLESRYFTHFLRLVVTFNGATGGAYKYPLTSRVVREFFCGPVPSTAAVRQFLLEIDAMLSSRFEGKEEDVVSGHVLDAIEALFFELRGGKLGRTILLVDEISKATLTGSSTSAESLVYRAVVDWINDAPLSSAYGRRGVVFTSVAFLEPWSEFSTSGRKLLWLPLGTFDVWNEVVQSVIAGEAISLGLLGDNNVVDQRVWSLLAATGGRPRDIGAVLVALQASPCRALRIRISVS